MAAAFLSYAGPFSFEYRQTMLHDDWEQSLLDKGIPLTHPWKVQEHLTSDVEISKYVLLIILDIIRDIILTPREQVH